VILLDLIVAFTITFLLLIASVFKEVFLAYPLAAGIILFSIVALRRGFHFKDILKMAYTGGKKSYIVVEVFILIGALISIWIASGAVPAIVYYGIELIKPNLFILLSFLISCFVSFLIGTAVGTAGIVGAALMVIARSGGVNLSAAAGAIIAGSFFGDRCSPVSSSANFVANITETNVYDNIKIMFKTSIIPFTISMIFYMIVSQIFPIHSKTDSIHKLIPLEFDLNWVVLIPVLVIIIFSIFKTNIKISILISIIIAFIISITVQHQTILECIKFLIFGFSLADSSPLHSIIKGGGIISLLKTAIVVFLASTFAGIVEGTEILSDIEKVTLKANSRWKVFRNVLITSLLGAMVGGSQTFTVMLTYILNKKAYAKNKLDNSYAAIDLENTAIMVSALIPWNIALLASTTILDIGIACIPYLMYIYLVPLWNLLYLILRENIFKNYKFHHWRDRQTKVQ